VPQDYLGVPKQYYEPVARGREKQFREWVTWLREQRTPQNDDQGS